MKPIKVLHVVEIDKEAHYFNNLVDFTDRNEIEFSFVTFMEEGEFTESLRSRDFRVYALDVASKSSLPRAAKDLWKIMKAEEPDVVHTHLFDPTFIGLLLAKAQKRKTVITRHHSDAIHLIPNALKRSLYLAAERLNNRNADHIIAPSKMVRECVVEWEKTPSPKVSLIPYGQTSDRFDAITPELVMAKRAELKMDEQLSLVCVSRLFHGKGHKFLFRALEPLIHNGLDVKLYLVGSGDYQENLKRSTQELGIAESVEFLGWRDDILAIIGAADIIVHPSLEDALSQSLIESLMLARPIIATNISGASDILDGGKYGRLVPPADAVNFQAALAETIENLEDARRNAKAGKAYLLEYMDAKRVADEYRRIYQTIVEC